MNKSIKLFSILFMLVWGVSCQRNYTPKPKAYFRIEFPERAYQQFDTNYPYAFKYPKYCIASPDTSYGSEKYWINIEFPKFNGKIHISYKSIKDNFQELMEDSRKLAYKHSVKADAIGEKMFIDDDQKVYGILYDIQGDAASSIQFFATDSTKHFLRGSLYFNSKPNKDSLAPVIKFVKEDIIVLMESLNWKE